jgi:hypothetical protein
VRDSRTPCEHRLVQRRPLRLVGRLGHHLDLLQVHSIAATMQHSVLLTSSGSWTTGPRSSHSREAILERELRRAAASGGSRERSASAVGRCTDGATH